MAGIGHNSGARLQDDGLTGSLRQLQATYNRARIDKADAASQMRDIKKFEREKSRDAFEAIESVMQSAKEKIKARLRERDDYKKAEADSAEAAARLREINKQAKAKGIDIQALKIAFKMAEMDSVEREDYFDAIDAYAKALRLWGEHY